VAIRAKELEVLEPVVVRVAVYVVKLERDRRAEPILETTDVAPEDLRAGGEQPRLDVC
jgi:hypothetical protein